MKKYKTDHWTVNVPVLWDAEADEGCDVLYDKAGIGELVFSTLYQSEGVSDEQLEEMAAEHLDADVTLEDVNINDFSGFVISYTQEGEYWCEWYLRTDKILLFVSYNCKEGNEEVDEDVVESILDSIEVLAG